ncbi:MAG: alpha-amylase [Bacteroidales bacterium]|nr:alpha-amylase [Bacteroidales bacterium]
MIPAWVGHRSLYEVNLRQYTPQGSFNSFRMHLPRLAELGAGILWFMPFQPIGVNHRKGTLGSYYSIRDYQAVDPTAGTMDDFRALVSDIHRRGVRVIIDWVANHTAWDHVWTKEHPEFYTKDDQGRFRPPNPDWTDTLQLDYSNQELWDAMISAMQFWLNETGIDGFRCDMAHLVPLEFWQFARQRLDPQGNLLMLAESEDKRLLDAAFDVLYNWNLFHAFNDAAAGKIGSGQLKEVITREIQGYPEGKAPLLFTSNHDENSWNGSAVERLGPALEPLSLIAFTLPGIPLIYSGQEAGLSKRLSFFEKDPVDWRFDKMTPFYGTLNALRKRNSPLFSLSGPSSFCLPDCGDEHAIAFVREHDPLGIILLANLSPRPADIRLPEEYLQWHCRDIFSGKEGTCATLTNRSPGPWEYMALERKAPKK